MNVENVMMRPFAYKRMHNAEIFIFPWVHHSFLVLLVIINLNNLKMLDKTRFQYELKIDVYLNLWYGF